MAMADDDNENSTHAKPRGCFSRLIVLILLLSAVGLGFSIYFMAQPQDLSDIHGYTPETRALLRRDIKLMLKNSLDRSYPVTLTEGEINQWLLGVLKASQSGPLADKVTVDGVWVRLEDGRAEVVLERKVMGKPFTVSMYLQIEQTESENGARTEVQFHGGPYHNYLPFPKCGGRFGKLPIPQGFLLLIMPSLKNLAAAFPEEIRLGFEEMTRVEIKKNRLTLDPRVPQRTVTSPP
jgi:hypothetical protein